MLSSLLLSSSFLFLVAAKPLLSSYVLHERRAHVPKGWSRIQKHDAEAILPLRFGLTQANLENIGDYVIDVSHPDSPNYANHWSPARVAETFAPTSETVDVVRSWLLSSGFAAEHVRVMPSQGWIEVNATVEEAERLLRAEYHVYRHESGKKHVACDEYHLPEHISPNVDLVMPTVHFNVILDKRDSGRSAKSIGQPGSGQGPKTGTRFKIDIGKLSDDVDHCSSFITLACLRELYGLSPSWAPQSADRNSLAVSEFTPQAYLQSDLDMFSRRFSPALVGKSPEFVPIDGGVLQTDFTGFDYNAESALDLEYAMSLVTSEQNVTLYQVGDIVEGASFNNFLDALDGSYCTFKGGDDPYQDATYPDPYPGGYSGKDCGTAMHANIISTSYGYNEADLSRAYAARQCAEYAKLGLMGITMLFSSGDYGVGGNDDGNCLGPDGQRFNPSFPSTCPYVTSVGATQVMQGAKVTDPEIACETIITSGGGFSNYFSMPDYQKSAVDAYLENHKPTYPPDQWNSTGNSRAFPDVSANGANYVVAIDGEFVLVYGTSASAPVFAAILTMVNDARITRNKKPIGFINPVIYSPLFSGAFNDITSGGNPGCGTDGFFAVQGWDPVTGLGTPNLGRLVERWLLLP